MVQQRLPAIRIGLLLSLALSTAGGLPATAQAGGVWYVRAGGADTGLCATPATACATINVAIGKAAAGDRIVIAADVFQRTSGSEVVRVDKPIFLSGGWDSDFTAQTGFTHVDGGGTSRGILVTADGDLTLERFIIEQGYASQQVDWGGGILNLGTLRISISEIRDNQGGGLSSRGAASVQDSSLIGNASPGGVFSQYGSLTVTNSTISDNIGCGICMNGPGPAQISSSTIAYNYVAGAIAYGIHNNSPDTVHVRNTIVASNAGYDCKDQLSLEGYNLLGSATGCSHLKSQASDRIGLDPQLGELTGLPRHRPLLAASPAIDAGDPAGCRDALGVALDRDMRGMARVGRCDIGAFELGLTLAKHVSGVTLPGGQVTFTLALRNLENSVTLPDVVLTDTLPAGLTLVPGTLTATTGAATTDGATINWSGPVPPGSGSRVQFAAVIDAVLPLGASLTNTATASWQGLTLDASASLQARVRVFLPQTAQRFCADFLDDFEEAGSGWPSRDDAIATLGYDGGEYRILLKQPYLEAVAAPACRHVNYLVESDMRWVMTTGSAYGLVFGLVGDFEAAYVLEVNAVTPAFRVRRLTPDGNWVIIQDWTRESAITVSGTNHVRVVRQGSAITIRINAVQVAALQDTAIMGPTGAGILAMTYPGQSGVEARFDRFQVTGLSDDGQTAIPGTPDRAPALPAFQLPIPLGFGSR